MIAAVINALKLVRKNIEDVTIVINGAGSAGVAIANMLLNMNPKDILLCDRKGIINVGSPSNDESKEEMARKTNKNKVVGDLSVAMKGSDIFIGVSAANVVTEEMVKSMSVDPIIFAMANPVPEIYPDLALKAGAKVVGSGRSDFPNQVNNVLAFPGIFRGALDVRAKDINEEMKLAAAYAIASIIEENELKPEYVIPDAFDKMVVSKVAAAVSQAARESGVARK